MKLIKLLLFLILVAVAWPLALALVCVWLPLKLLVLNGKAAWLPVRVAQKASPPRLVCVGERGPELIDLPAGAKVRRG